MPQGYEGDNEAKAARETRKSIHRALRDLDERETAFNERSSYIKRKPPEDFAATRNELYGRLREASHREMRAKGISSPEMDAGR